MFSPTVPRHAHGVCQVWCFSYSLAKTPCLCICDRLLLLCMFVGQPSFWLLSLRCLATRNFSIRSTQYARYVFGMTDWRSAWILESSCSRKYIFMVWTKVLIWSHIKLIFMNCCGTIFLFVNICMCAKTGYTGGSQVPQYSETFGFRVRAWESPKPWSTFDFICARLFASLVLSLAWCVSSNDPNPGYAISTMEKFSSEWRWAVQMEINRIINKRPLNARSIFILLTTCKQLLVSGFLLECTLVLRSVLRGCEPKKDNHQGLTRLANFRNKHESWPKAVTQVVRAEL